MTFRDISLHRAIFLFTTTLQLACWAPEVVPNEPKRSPAELAGIAVANASASPINNTVESIETTQKRSLMNNRHSIKAQTPVGAQPESAQPENADKQFPYTTPLTGDNIPLLGHGGGTIMTLSAEQIESAQIDVLEERDGKVRILCKGCSIKHPFQAGWISSEYLPSDN